MRILIIRHGDPDYAHDSLTEKGFREAKLLSETLARENIKDIYCSPLGRAKKTAEPTAALTGAQPIVLDWLREFSAQSVPPYEEYGIETAWRPGCPWNMMPQYWTKQPEFFDAGRWEEHPLYAGSDVVKVCAGIDRGWDSLTASYGYVRKGRLYDIAEGADESVTIALFCHLGLGLALVSRILGGPLPFIWQSFFLPTTSVTTILTEKYAPYGRQAVMRVIGLGDVSHLKNGGEPVSSSGLHSEIDSCALKFN